MRKYEHKDAMVRARKILRIAAGMRKNRDMGTPAFTAEGVEAVSVGVGTLRVLLKDGGVIEKPISQFCLGEVMEALRKLEEKVEVVKDGNDVVQS